MNFEEQVRIVGYQRMSRKKAPGVVLVFGQGIVLVVMELVQVRSKGQRMPG